MAASAASAGTAGTVIASDKSTNMDNLFGVAFLVVQGISALYSFISAFLLRDTFKTGWHQYQNFYGFLLNSSYLTFFISLLLFNDLAFGGPGQKKADIVVQSDAHIQTDEFRQGHIGALCLVGVVLVPPLITHFIPGVVLYCWILLIAFLGLIAFFVILVAIGVLLGFGRNKNTKYGVFTMQTPIRLEGVYRL